MRHLILAFVTCFLCACATARPNDVTVHAPAQSATTCDVGGPLISVDGVLQGPRCSKSILKPAAPCKAEAPMLIIDGVLICPKS